MCGSGANKLKPKAMSYDDYKLESPYNDGSGWYEESKEIDKCVLCLESFERDELFCLEQNSTQLVCSECLHFYHNQEP